MLNKQLQKNWIRR